jgi:hypothetical protein
MEAVTSTRNFKVSRVVMDYELADCNDTSVL